MIKISNIRLKELENTTRLLANITYNSKIDELWYEVDKKFSKYLCYERADAFVDALLLFAMQHNEDIYIEDTPISSKLYFNLLNYIIPAISKLNGRYKKIKIYAQTSSENLENYNMNGTGISRGVDSFCTLKENEVNNVTQMKINFLTFFNVGSHRDFGGDEARKLFNKRKELSKEFALNNGFDFIEVDSNISEFLNQVFVETHTFRSTSAVFAIQKLFKNYYYSSGYTIYEFEVKENAPAKFETFLLNMLSNDNVSFYSSGCLYNRLEKTQIISDYYIAKENLNVCFKDEINCGKCEKCIRTMFEFYANGTLENFKKVFDVENFYKNIDWYETKFMKMWYLGKQDYIDAYNYMKKNKIKIKVKNKIKGYILFLASKLLSQELKIKLKRWRNENA